MRVLKAVLVLMLVAGLAGPSPLVAQAKAPAKETTAPAAAPLLDLNSATRAEL
jgi:hypothetical protein